MENDTDLDQSLDNGKAAKEELEKYLPEWFILLRELVAEYLYVRSAKNEDKTAVIAENEKPAPAEAKA